jgi:type I restriction enzyme, S subunit
MKEGWQLKSIGDVCEFQRGLTYTKGDEVDASDNIVLRATNIDLSSNLLSFDELKYISDKVVVPTSKIVKKGSLLICTASGSKSHLGKVAFIDDDYGYAFGGFMGMLTPLDGLLPKYLFRLMTSEGYKDFIGALSDGANINNLKFDDLMRFPVPVPPLPEQQRIVALLDEAFAGLAIAKANAERNLQNARAIFESHLQSVFTQSGPGWAEHTLGDLIEIQNGYAFKSTDYTETGYFVIRIGNVQDGEITLANPKFIKLADKKLERFILNEGDILISLTGNIGRVGIIQEGQLPAVLNQRVARIAIKGLSADRDFLFRFLLSRNFRESLQEAGHGAAQQNVSTKEIELVQISLPDNQEQRRIVEEFDSFALETQRLTRLYERKLVALEELKKALLHQAFHGEL